MPSNAAIRTSLYSPSWIPENPLKRKNNSRLRAVEPDCWHLVAEEARSKSDMIKSTDVDRLATAEEILAAILPF